jgi:UDP-glucuronate 4-epimerase
MRILVTGGAGFIGAHLINDLQADGFEVIGLDNYCGALYDPKLKEERVAFMDIGVQRVDMKHFPSLDDAFNIVKPNIVIHLGALAGVRDSYGKEREYIRNNIDATQNLIDCCKMYGVSRILYASTSCIYAGSPLPWREDRVTGEQLNAYGYTKRCNEMMFKSSGLDTVGMRFFTVYGHWGRPDMALYQFTHNILEGLPIQAFNNGNMKRDFTHISDIVAGIKCILFNETPKNEIYNIGRGKQVDLMKFIDCIGQCVGRKPIIELAPKHPADTLETWSDTTKLQKLGYKPIVDMEQGVSSFVRWYKEFYQTEWI